MMTLAMMKQEEIETLRAENERLREEIADLRSVICDELVAESQRLGLYDISPSSDTQPSD